MPRAASVVDRDVDAPTLADLAARIAALDKRIAALETERTRPRQAREPVLAVIVTRIGPGVAFSARELWRHRHLDPAVRAALVAAGITSPFGVGKCLQWLATHPGDRVALQRIGRDRDGATWVVTMR